MSITIIISPDLGTLLRNVVTHCVGIVTHWGRDERRRALSEVSRRSNPIPGIGAWQIHRKIKKRTSWKTDLLYLFFFRIWYDIISESIIPKLRWNLKGKIWFLKSFEATQATWMVTKWRTSSVRPLERLQIWTIIGWWDILLQESCEIWIVQ